MSDPLFRLPKEKIQHVMVRIFNEAVAILSDSRGTHLETAVSGLGATAGLYLLRAANLPINSLTPGEVVLSDAVNESGPELIGFASGAASLFGLPHDVGWDTPIPSDHEPLKQVIELTQSFEPRLNLIFSSEDVPDDLKARFCVMTAMDMIKQGEQILSSGVGKAILLRSIVAGSKTVPHPLP
jgi:hypothetical protein